MRVRLVSAMFDLSDEVPHRSPAGMIGMTRFLTSRNINLVLFVSRNLISQLPELGPNVRLVPMEKEELLLWSRYADVDRAREAFWPTRDPRAPTGSHLITCSKHHLVCRSIAMSPSSDPAAWVYWIDFGKDFFSFADVEAVRGFPEADVHFHLCNVVDPYLFEADLRTYFEHYRFSVCGGLVGARQDVWPDLARRLDEVLDRHLAAGVGHGEEQLLNTVLQDKDFLKRMRLHLSIGDYQELTSNLFAPRENKSHCAWVIRRMFETGRRDLLALVLPDLVSDPSLEALARNLMDTMDTPPTMPQFDAAGTLPSTDLPLAKPRVFRPAFSPGSCYLLQDSDEEAYFASHGGAPEASLIAWATQFIAHDETFIDVGSHVGSWAQHFALKCKQVHAFEPQRSTYARLRDGMQIAKLGNVVCHEVALGTHDEVDLHIVEKYGGWSTLRHRPEVGKVITTERVRGAQIDDF